MVQSRQAVDQQLHKLRTWIWAPIPRMAAVHSPALSLRFRLPPGQLSVDAGAALLIPSCPRQLQRTHRALMFCRVLMLPVCVSSTVARLMAGSGVPAAAALAGIPVFDRQSRIFLACCRSRSGLGWV